MELKINGILFVNIFFLFMDHIENFEWQTIFKYTTSFWRTSIILLRIKNLKIVLIKTNVLFPMKRISIENGQQQINDFKVAWCLFYLTKCLAYAILIRSDFYKKLHMFQSERHLPNHLFCEVISVCLINV